MEINNTNSSSKVQLDLSQESLCTFLPVENSNYTASSIDPVNDPEFMAYLASFSLPQIPSTTLDLSLLSDCLEVPKKERGLSKTGHCEHPKHVVYRQEKYTMSKSEPESSVLKTVPRRGRPPKGSKDTDINDESNSYNLVTLTVRPLPKRLEPVVGKKHIKVCLTCLKKSDIDPEYVSDVNYIAPQPVFKRRKQ
ncbi:hypothetical protein BY458DRAFT_511077 [Sporodiniella umbellata]|nr:hypothetical protein BY458DRAFT_511077 [Sporodiniella umbellata]